MKKRMLALLLTALMALSLMPTTVFAEGWPEATVTKITDRAAVEGVDLPDTYPILDFADAVAGAKEGQKISLSSLLDNKVCSMLPDAEYLFQAQDEEKTDYDGWYADFVVSFNEPVAKDSLGLVGYYAAWDYPVGFFAPLAIDDGQKFPLLNTVMQDSDWRYVDIRDTVKDFACGVFNTSTENIGTKFTVELRLFDDEVYKSPEDIFNACQDSNNTLNNTVVIHTETYTIETARNIVCDDGSVYAYVDTAEAEEDIPVDGGFYRVYNGMVKVTDENARVDCDTAYYKLMPTVVVEPVETIDDDKIEVSGGDVDGDKKQNLVDRLIQDVNSNTAATAPGSTDIEKAVREAKMTTGANLSVQKIDEAGTTPIEVDVDVAKNDTLKDVAEKVIKESDESQALWGIAERIEIRLDAVSTTLETVTKSTGSTVATATTSEEGMTFDVKPIATVTTSDGKSFEMIIPNELIKDHPITFRLPLDSRFDGVKYVVVNHRGETDDDPTNLGVYEVKTDDNNKPYVELSADAFSFYGVYFYAGENTSVTTEYKLVKAPTIDEEGTYREVTYQVDDEGNKREDTKVDGLPKPVTFAKWYLRTMVQYWTSDCQKIRFVSMLDGNLGQYKEAGFEVTYNGEQFTLKQTVGYESFTYGSNNNITVNAADYSKEGDHFFLETNTFSDDANLNIKVKPYVELLSGGKLYGEWVTFSINQVENAKNAG